MNKRVRKILLKPLASFLKRFYMLTNGGYSTGSAYGARFLFDWRHSLDKKVAVELYEYDQINYLIREIDRLKPDMFVDIGAHAGLYSIVAKKRRPELVVHAFEPDRTNLSQLYANLFLNRLQDSISVHEYGISDTSGVAVFNTSAETTSRGTRRISETGDTKIVVKRLDDVLQITNQRLILKIDVEGHERHVVDGAVAILTGNQCLMQVEATAENIGPLTHTLGALGYRLVTRLGDYYFTNLSSQA